MLVFTDRPLPFTTKDFLLDCFGTLGWSRIVVGIVVICFVKAGFDSVCCFCTGCELRCLLFSWTSSFSALKFQKKRDEEFLYSIKAENIAKKVQKTYKYLVMSSISINIESCRMLKSSRSIKYFTSTSFSVSINEWNSFIMIWSWAMFMFVSICRERRRFDGGTLISTFSSVWCTNVVIGHMPCFWRSIWRFKLIIIYDFLSLFFSYLHLHMSHVFSLSKSHSSFNLKSGLMREKIVVTRISWGWTNG